MAFRLQADRPAERAPELVPVPLRVFPGREHLDDPVVRRPDAHMNAAGDRLGADGKPPLRRRRGAWPAGVAGRCLLRTSRLGPAVGPGARCRSGRGPLQHPASSLSAGGSQRARAVLNDRACIWFRAGREGEGHQPEPEPRPVSAVDRPLTSRVQQRREGTMKVSECMTADATTIDVSSTLVEAAHVMQRHDTGFLPVMEDGRLVGVVTITTSLSAASPRGQPVRNRGRRGDVDRGRVLLRQPVDRRGAGADG